MRTFLILTCLTSLALAPIAAAQGGTDESNAVPLAVPSTTSGTNGGSSGPSPCAGMGASVWYVIHATNGGDIELDMRGSNYDTALAVWDGAPSSGGSLVACNDDHFGLQSYIAFTALPGRSYWIQVSGYSGQVGQYVLDARGPPQAGGSACFAYNPSALTNACIVVADGTTDVPTPQASANPTTGAPLVCIIGNVCVPSVDPGLQTGMGSTPVTHPGPKGYFEATAACGLVAGCRVSFG